MTVTTDLPALAATLEERRRHPASAVGDAGRLAEWKHFVARDDDERWARRLRFDDIDPAMAPLLVGTVSCSPPGAAPAWMDVLREALAIARAIAERPLLDDPRADALPFEHVVWPFVLAARERLASSGAPLSELAPAAHRDFERGLLQRLSTIAAPVIYQEFSAAGGGAEHIGTSAAPSTLYRQFVRDQLAGDLERVFARYGALARLLATRVLLWTDTTSALLAHLNADRRAIARVFPVASPLGTVTEARVELSDPHDGGRMVSILTFASGARMVYKPRSLAPERAFEQFVTWANARRGTMPALSALRVLDRGTHGWMEVAEADGDTDAAGLARFYRRAGMLSCAMYLLAGKDLHSGNVLARRDDPLLVDLEMLVQPAIADEGVGDAAAVGSWRLVHGSALSTHLHPMLSRGAMGGTWTEGGLVPSDTGVDTTMRRWRDVNTDAMALYAVPAVAAASENVPRASTSAHHETQVAELMRGFRQFYRLLHRERRALLAADGPLAPFRSLRVRLLLRSTDVYESLQRRSFRPHALATGADRSIDFDALRRPFLQRPDRHRLWDAVRSEVEALERGDVPLFHIQADERSLRSAGAVVIDDYVGATGAEELLARVRRLGRADLVRQSHFLRLAWTGYAERAAPRRTPRTPRGPSLAIADRLRRVATPSARGGVEWTMLGDTGLRTTDQSFANGGSGIAFFLAALARTTGADVRDLAMNAIAPLLAPGLDVARLRRTHGIGAARGLGGIVYALTRIGAWLDEPAALDAARRIAGGITERRIDRDRTLDVFDGSAGALLGLLALHGATGSTGALARAHYCGRHLLAHRSRDPVSGHRAWRTMGGLHTAGFAHGAAGIAHALGRLDPSGAHAGTRDAVAESREFERSLFVSAEGNWASTAARAVANGASPLICGWCHGAAGIGIGRVASTPTLDAASRQDVELALEAISVFERRPAAQDHLCCGNAGRIELLHSAGERLGRPDLVARGREYAGRITERARHRTVWGAGSVDDVFAPSLFFGIAGIGYELLRLDHPATLPSVLTWD